MRLYEDSISAAAIPLSAPCDAGLDLASFRLDEHECLIPGECSSEAESAATCHADRTPPYRYWIINGIYSQCYLSLKEGQEKGFSHSRRDILHRLPFGNDSGRNQSICSHQGRN
jgi:hypothetical protein